MIAATVAAELTLVFSARLGIKINSTERFDSMKRLQGIHFVSDLHDGVGLLLRCSSKSLTSLGPCYHTLREPNGEGLLSADKA